MMNIPSDTNFCRIFELPVVFPEAYCFGGGLPVTFQLVDWFNPIPLVDEINGTIQPWNTYLPGIKEFLQQKDYLKPNRTYLCITDFGEAFVFKKEDI